MKQWMQFLAGGVATYVIVAACGAGDDFTAGGAGGAHRDGSVAIRGGSFGGDVVVGGSPSGGSGQGGSSSSTGGAGGIVGTIRDAAADVVAALDAIADSVVDSGVADAVVDPVHVADAAESGTRIKARWWVGTDGSRQFVGWFDSQLNVDCSFQIASDGSRRCAPNAVTGAVFSDASCTQRVAPVSSDVCTGTAPGYAIWLSSVNCETRTHFAAVGPAIAAPANLYELNGGACIAAGSSCDPPFCQWHSVGGELQPSEFVEFNSQIDP